MFRPSLLAATALFALVACSENRPPAMTGLTEIVPPAGPGSQVPRLTRADDGGVWLSWLEAQDGGVQAFKAAVLRDDGWSEPITIASGDDWFINWADFPSLLVGPGGTMAAHWLAKTPGSVYAYDVVLSVSGDGGETWTEPLSPHDDGTATEHGFVSLFPRETGFGALWLDGREMAPGGAADSGHGHGPGGMTLRAALLDTEGRVLRGDLVDDLTCDCCQTGAAVTGAGPLVVYRDRTEGEIRDISFSAFRDGRWTAGRPVAIDGWQITACPVNGPAIDARGPDAVVGWFTGAPRPMIRAAFWSDEEDGFLGVMDVSDDRPLGRVDAVLLADGSAVVSWLAATETDDAEIRFRQVWRDGRQGADTVLARTAASRMSGFPQMTTSGGRLIFAWTVPGDPPVIRSATVPAPGGDGT